MILRKCLLLVFGAALLAGLAFGQLPPQAKPEVRITTIPPAMEGGEGPTYLMEGTVSGLDFRTHRIVAWAFAGGQWWVQPTVASFKTPLDVKSGEWSLDTHGGSQYAVTLVVADYQLPNPTTSKVPEVGNGVLAVEIVPGRRGNTQRASRRLSFSGYDFTVKASDNRVGPGPNYFGDDAVELTPEGLKLKVVERDGRYICGEVVSQLSFGYGVYRFTVASNTDDLAPNLTLGLFTWSDDPAFAHRELDVEVGRWNDPENDAGQFVVQPYTRVGNMLRFPIPRGHTSTTYTFTWLPASVNFRAEANTPSGPALIKEHTFSGGIPRPGDENVRMNLWMMSGSRPLPGTAEVTIRSFEFKPAG